MILNEDKDIKVLCVNLPTGYEGYEIGKQYDATYIAPSVFNHTASVLVKGDCHMCDFDWDEFSHCFKVLDDDFHPLVNIQLVTQ